MNLQSATQVKEVILPLSYLPCIDHYCYIIKADSVKFEVLETFPKQTCRNRTSILTGNGVLRLTIPVIKLNGNRTRTLEVQIDNKANWNKIHWRAISSAYNKSPFFLYYKDELEAIYQQPDDLLVDFNARLMNQINKFLKIKRDFSFTTEFLKEYEGAIDKRNGKKLHKTVNHQLKPYNQVFSDRHPFEPNLSILDLLFNQGPDSISYLKENNPMPG